MITEEVTGHHLRSSPTSKRGSENAKSDHDSLHNVQSRPLFLSTARLKLTKLWSYVSRGSTDPAPPSAFSVHTGQSPRRMSLPTVSTFPRVPRLSRAFVPAAQASRYSKAIGGSGSNIRLDYMALALRAFELRRLVQVLLLSPAIHRHPRVWSAFPSLPPCRNPRSHLGMWVGRGDPSQGRVMWLARCLLTQFGGVILELGL